MIEVSMSSQAPIRLQRPIRRLTSRFSAIRTSSTSHHPIQLILDFDGTLTTRDTLSTLSQIGYRHSPSPSKPWTEIVDAYIDDYDLHESNYHSPKEERTSIAQEVAWLNTLKPIEEASAARVQDAGVLTHLTESEITSGAENAIKTGDVTFRKGWAQFLQRVSHFNSSCAPSGSSSSSNGTVAIVSVNFSRQFIWSCLKAATSNLQKELTCTHTPSTAADDISKIAIYANEMTGCTSSKTLCTPHAGNATTLRTSGDKLAQTLKICATANSVMVYVGDSTTDLACLLTADIGICIRDCDMGAGQRDLAETCQRVGIAVNWIGECKALAPKGDEAGETLWWAKDFEDVDRWLASVVDAKTG